MNGVNRSGWRNPKSQASDHIILQVKQPESYNNKNKSIVYGIRTQALALVEASCCKDPPSHTAPQ